MKNKGVRKFLRCLKPVDVDDEDDDWPLFRKFNDDDLGNENIFVSFNSSSGGGRKPKRDHQKIPRFLKKMFIRKSNFWNRFKDKISLETTKDVNSHEHENTPSFHRNSSDSGSSIFTSSSMASSPLASSTCSSTVPSKLISREMKKACPNDQEFETIEEKNNINKNNYKKDLMEKEGGCYFGKEYGICFLMLGLLILLIWGKLFAIFFTSLCLFFASPYRLMKVIHNNPQQIFDDKMLYVEVLEKQGIMEEFSKTI